MKISTRDIVLVSLFTALTALLALFVTIPLPFSPVPLTGQSLAVMLAGGILGARRGFLSQLVYVLLGAAGVPVFAGGQAGIGVLAGPRGGFLWGFMMGAFVIGKLVEKKKKPPVLFLVTAMLAGGVMVVYIPGIIQLSLVTSMSLPEALAAMLPYLPGDVLKAIVAAFLTRRVREAVWE